MRYCFAPMDGVTNSVFRRVHRQFFPETDRYYTPFVSPTSDRILTPRELRELLPEYNRGVPVIPQLLTKNAGDFLWAAGRLAEMGYAEVNLNLGCPSGTVVAKGKGSGLLADPDALDRLLDAIYARTPLRVSLKTRLGVREPEEFPRLLEIYNRYPVSELILHARTAREMYRGPAHRDVFARCLPLCRAPVCYNGDLATAEDCRAFCAAFPGAAAAMPGRGFAADPALVRQARGGAPLTKTELLAFHQTLYAAYQEAYGPLNGMHRMKELWRYLIWHFDSPDRLAGRLARVRDCAGFEYLIAAVFQELTLLPDGGAVLAARGNG